MKDASGRPQRMRYSFETRCRAVAAMLTGVRPGAAAQAVGASRATGYRWWRRYVSTDWARLEARIRPVYRAGERGRPSYSTSANQRCGCIPLPHRVPVTREPRAFRNHRALLSQIAQGTQ